MNPPLSPDTPTETASARRSPLRTLADAAEMLGFATVLMTLLFSFAMRLTVVEGSSMRPTLSPDDRLAVIPCAALEPGDIVIVHRIDAAPYSRPIVKRVIALPGQTIDIDFDTWILTVDGTVVEEPYRCPSPSGKTRSSSWATTATDPRTADAGSSVRSTPAPSSEKRFSE